MLLTIHNLPSHMRYVDIKSLIHSKCGLSEIILDNLVNEGQYKKVTVGVSEEEDAALLVRQINGLFMEGQMLYVEDVRQKKASEQPYRSAKVVVPSQSNQPQINPWSTQQQGYSYGMGLQNPFMQQDQSMMLPAQMMGGMYFMQPQNSFMEYGSQVLQQSSNPSQYSQGVDNSQEVQQVSSDYYARNNNIRDNNKRSRDWGYEDNDSYQQNRQHNNSDRSRSSRWQNNDNEDSRERYRSRSPRGEQPPGRLDGKYLDNNTRPDYRQRNITSTNNFPEAQRGPAIEGYSNRNYDNNRQSKWDQQYVPPNQQEHHYRQAQSSYVSPSNNSPKQEQWSNRSQDKSSPQKIWDNPAPINKNFQQQSRYPSVASSGNMPRSSKRWDNNAPRSVPALYKPQPKRMETRSSFNEKKKTNSNPSTRFQKPSNYETLVRKDETWRHQAASKIKNDIIRKYLYPEGLSPTIVDKAVKLAIHTRIELILKGEMGVEMDTMVLRYRKLFPEDGDKALYDAVVQNVRKDMSEKLEEIQKQDAVISEETGAEPTASAAAATVAPYEMAKAENAVQKQELKKDPEIPSDKVEVYKVPTQKLKQAHEPVLGRLPKYPQGNKKDQKRALIMEYNEENPYILDPPLALALEEQLDIFCSLFKGELQNPTNECEVFVFEKLCNESVNSFRKSVKVNLTKRILDIRTNLIVRVFATGKVPKVADVNEFMKKFGVISLKKSVGKKLFYTANMSTYEDYDRLCAMGSAIMNPNTALIFKPFQLTGPKSKVKIGEISKKNREFIQSSEDYSTDPTNQNNEEYDITADEDLICEDAKKEFENNENCGDESFDDEHNVDEMINEMMVDDEHDVVEQVDNGNEIFEHYDEVYEVKDEDFEDY